MLLLALGFPSAVSSAEPDPNPAVELKKLSLEELMNLEVTSVSRTPTPLFTVPSAIQVITSEDVHRSGATSIPEALRLAPNLQVAQVDSRQWAISARGFNNTLANKLLVMIDGRSIYTPLFAGVFWDVQDMLLEDLDKIEVVSGPGGNLWGANAVNGVINITSKSARDTQGTLVTAGGGTLLRAFAGGRYGTELGKDLYFRVSGNVFARDNTVMPDGRDATNNWHLGQGGFRLDWLPPDGNTLTVQGDGYGGSISQFLPGDISVDGQNLLARWSHSISEDSETTLQMYWDRTYRRVPTSFTEELNTYDVDFQHRVPLGNRQSIVWGASYRLMADRATGSPSLTFIPSRRDLQLFGAFVQDEIVIVEEKLKLMLGTKLEHNDFSGFEVQPSGRLAWTPDDKQTIWTAISRAVRSPSRIDTDLYFPGTAPYQIAGGNDFDSEKLLAYELGYRWRPVERLSLSLAGFYHDYDDIRSLEPLGTNSFVIANGNRAEEWGFELSGNLQLTKTWRLRGGYTFLEKTTEVKPGGRDLNRGRAEGNDPQNQFVIQSILDLAYHLQLDSTCRFVDTLPAPNVPSYFTFDVRLAWHPLHNLELSIIGQNLLDEQHPEFGAPATRQEIVRNVYAKVSWSF
jgi:iron complex outermembrane receptor protein